jgi:hypothetical protein
MAWMTFGALILSLGAAVVGAVVGRLLSLGAAVAGSARRSL